MKKQFFTLLTFLVVCVTGAWATIDSYVADSRHAASVTSESSYNGTAFSFSKSNAYNITQDKSQATASDDNTLKFSYGFLPSGSTTSGSCYTLTALKDISSLKIYYTIQKGTGINTLSGELL